MRVHCWRDFFFFLKPERPERKLRESRLSHGRSSCGSFKRYVRPFAPLFCDVKTDCTDLDDAGLASTEPGLLRVPSDGRRAHRRHAGFSRGRWGVFLIERVRVLTQKQAMIVGPTDTPYVGGCFLFDLYCPSTYPNSPPLVHLLTTGNGSVRFNPNLYHSGKVSSPFSLFLDLYFSSIHPSIFSLCLDTSLS